MTKRFIEAHDDQEHSIATFRIEDETLRQIAKVAKKQDQSRSAVVREALRFYLERRKA